MTKAELEKLAFDYPNDFDLGGILRQLIPSIDENTKDENTKGENTKEENTDSPEVEWKNAYARLAADFDNYRKRTLKEREDVVTRTKTAMLEPIMDMDSDISLAVESIKDEKAKEGMKLILSKLSKFLSTHGVESIQTDTYDSDKHEVISTLTEGGTDIHAVVSKGYSFGDKIIRFPKVILK